MPPQDIPGLDLSNLDLTTQDIDFDEIDGGWGGTEGVAYLQHLQFNFKHTFIHLYPHVHFPFSLIVVGIQENLNDDMVKHALDQVRESKREEWCV